MEGLIARWYAGNTSKSIELLRKEAQEIARQMPVGSDVLEVAPGPGFLAIELAKLGSYCIVGVDISKTFVRIATENAVKAGVEVAFREGNASQLPFEAASFDFVYCRAAFKNFSEPIQALNEIYRVLKPGGTALIRDMRRDATATAINTAVQAMGLGWINSLLTRWILSGLRRRAYSEDDFRKMVAQTPFKICDIKYELIGVEVSLRKTGPYVMPTGQPPVHLTVSRIIADPKPSYEWQEERTFKWRDGAWRITFHDPVEFHMGAVAWRAELICGEKDVSSSHQKLKLEGLSLPHKYQPWCYEKPVLTLSWWFNNKPYANTCLYNAEDSRLVELSLNNWPTELQWRQ